MECKLTKKSDIKSKSIMINIKQLLQHTETSYDMLTIIGIMLWNIIQAYTMYKSNTAWNVNCPKKVI